MSASEPAEELPQRRAPSADKVTECRLAPDEPMPLPDGEPLSPGEPDCAEQQPSQTERIETK